METISVTEKMIIRHKDYNLAKQDNLQEVPAGPAIFAIFAIIDDRPVNCRYISATDNLQEAVTALFENSRHEGLQKFMRGPWIKMLQFNRMPDASPKEIQEALRIWEQQYDPKIDKQGEYPGYYGNL